MKKTLAKLSGGLESSSGTTPEFTSFVKTFKSEFTKELKAAGATGIKISEGHFYLSGFYTVGEQVWYFSTGDVRDGATKIMYRTARDYKDFSGGSNRWTNIQEGMAKKMHGGL